ncbi:MAG: choice-of-anchor Q domain-containing protein [Cyanobacteria bacterium J06559_3]
MDGNTADTAYYATAYGGGIRKISGSLTVSYSTVSENEANGRGAIGGGIHSGSGNSDILYSTVSNNVANGDFGGNGGGISSANGNLTITSSTVNHNLATGSRGTAGAGINASGESDISNSTITNNEVFGRGYGGGVVLDGQGVISNSTITENTGADGYGNGVSGGNLEITSSIISGNGGNDDVNGFNLVSGGNNLIGSAVRSNVLDAFNQSGDIVGVTNPGLEPLADNGGPTQTRSLQPGSLAIDGGSNPDGLANDQRGEGFARVVGAQADIGAFELQTLPPDDNTFFFSGTKDKALGDLAIENEDIVFFDGNDFSLFFDGSDVLPTNLEIRAFDVISDTTILMSFDRDVTLAGVGLVDDADVVEFTAASLGAGTTSGTFALYLDGSDIGLNSASEDIDALTRLTDGSLLLSTTGNAALPGGVFAQDEDLIRFTPTSLGNDTSGTASLYLDGSDVDLNGSGEDITAIGVQGDELLFSTVGNLSVPGLSGRDEDIASFTPTLIGETTAGSFGDELFFDGNTFGFTGNVTGFDVGIG